MTLASKPDQPVAEDAATLANEVLKKVIANVKRAIAVRALYVRCANEADIIESFSNTWECHGFETVRNSLLLEFTMILLRIYDSGEENTASLQHLSRLLSSIQDQSEEFANALTKIESLKGDHRLRALRQLRNHVLAHTAIKYSRSPPARYGYAEAILDETVDVVWQLANTLIGIDYDFQEQKAIWSKYAEAFWIRASKGEEQEVQW
jgi:hypothetical protein